jgi:hypothetical protein
LFGEVLGRSAGEAGGDYDALLAAPEPDEPGSPSGSSAGSGGAGVDLDGDWRHGWLITFRVLECLVVLLVADKTGKGRSGRRASSY